MILLGINAYHAEASAAILRDGELIAAAEEERFVRVKHVAGFPTEAIRYCLREAGVRADQIDAVALSRNPWAHLWMKAGLALKGGLSPHGVQERLGVLARIRNLRQTLADALGEDPAKLKARIHFVEHHRAHIASSFYPSGWEEACVLSLDGSGDLMSGLWGAGRGNKLLIEGGAAFPHSLGILYTAITQFLGFPQWGEEYKVMGLAAYGDAGRYRAAMETLVREAEKGGYRLGLDYFRHHRLDSSMTWAAGAPTLSPLFSEAMEKLLGPARKPGEPMEQRHSDIAAALQTRLEQVCIALLRRLGERSPVPKLCYAGGVALNCALNGKILEQTPFRQVFIQPAAHDAGTSLGAALYAAHHLYGQPRRFVMSTAAWGPAVSEGPCLAALEASKLPFRKLDPQELCRTTAEAIASGKIIGWFQGRMEFGPRSLGHRSLLADPRDPAMKDRINQRIKRRETFRPFAPSVLEEAVQEYFPGGHPDRFMLFAYPTAQAKQAQIPAVTHADGTGRLQAVGKSQEPLFWSLIKEFENRSGVPIVLNTSFNEQEPIVCRPEEAVSCFQRNAVDCLALGPYWVDRSRPA